jgi:hypothetical protein
MSEKKKRKTQSEHWVFNTEWVNKYLFTVSSDKILCLVHRKMVGVLQEYNLRTTLKLNVPFLPNSKEGSWMKNFSGEQKFFKQVSSVNETSTKLINFQWKLLMLGTTLEKERL